MKSLPTALYTQELEQLLLELPSYVKVTRYEGLITAHATKKATGEKVKFLSAASQDGIHWHVMAIDGLINTTIEI